MTDMEKRQLAEAYPSVQMKMIEAREAKGLHPRRVAELMNVSYPYYRRIELGLVTPEVELAERIGRLLGVDAARILEGGSEA